MAKKLTSFLKSKIGLRLSLEALVSGLSLFLIWFSNFSWWSILVFIFWFGRLYFRHLPQLNNLRFSFWLLPLLALIGFAVSPTSALSLFIILIFIIVFFILLAVANFLFRDNYSVYGFLNTVLLLFIFLIYFSFQNFETSFWPLFWKQILFFLVIVLLFKEVFSFYGITLPKKILTVSLAAAFLALEISVFLSFLPLGLVNASIFMALLFLLLRDAGINYFQGRLTRNYLFRQLTFYVVLTIIIFAAAKWSL